MEDAAHTFETVSNIGKVGNTNHAAAFSFYTNKNITTGGEGGAIATNNSVLAKRLENYHCTECQKMDGEDLSEMQNGNMMFQN